MHIVDTKGQQCPAPLIATKRALKETQQGDSFQVISDSLTSFNNISRFLKDNNINFSSSVTEGIWTITVTRNTNDDISSDPRDYCLTEVPHFSKGDFVVVFSSDKMGDGDDDLGQLLVLNFIKAIKDLDKLPSKMIFYNRGVFLGVGNSPVAGHLKELESMGVTLLYCATCVKHYDLDAKIDTGILSNMYEIAQVMASSSNVLKP